MEHTLLHLRTCIDLPVQSDCQMMMTQSQTQSLGSVKLGERCVCVCGNVWASQKMIGPPDLSQWKIVEIRTELTVYPDLRFTGSVVSFNWQTSFVCKAFV